VCANSANGPLLAENHVQLAERERSQVSQSAYIFKTGLDFFSFKLDCVNITREIKPRGLREQTRDGERGRKLSDRQVQLG
jgi:hypothetical protein